LKIGKHLFNLIRMEIVRNGVLSGLVLALLIGPVFFTLIQTSIERGFRAGAWVALGISFSDTVYIVISYLGLYQFFESALARERLAYIGGGVLILFGAYYLFVKSRNMLNFLPEHIKVRSAWRLVAKGFLINGLSPMVLLFWIGTVGFASTEFGYTQPLQAFVYFTAIIFTVFATDLIKAKLADKLRLLITPKAIQRLNILMGSALIFFGFRLIFFADTLSLH
jgi:threonine/homoserine/homoserine lactone efflux protein